LVRTIRNKYPSARITYLTGAWSKDAIIHNPLIDEIITFEDSIIFKRNIWKLWQLITDIRRRRFDIAFILDKSKWFGLLIKLAGIKERIGFDRNGEGKFNTKNVIFRGGKHEIDYYLETAQLIGAKVMKKDMDFFIPSEDSNFATDFMKKNELGSKIIGVAPGGAKNPGEENGLRRWPIENYIQLINLAAKHYSVIIFGGPGDKDTCDKVYFPFFRNRKVINTCGKLTLAQSAALIQKSNYLVTHDSGLMHLGVAVKTPTIALFGPTDPVTRIYTKGTSNHALRNTKVVCSPCYTIYGRYPACKDNICMKSINPKKVYEIIRS
jgi:lipopolysaccharide heptosyltransferase II